jgi:hypothetical protein
MDNQQFAAKLTDLIVEVAKHQAATHGETKEEFDSRELLVALVGVAQGGITLIAQMTAQVNGANDSGHSLLPGFARYVGTALFNSARDQEVAANSLAAQRVAAGGKDARPN